MRLINIIKRETGYDFKEDDLDAAVLNTLEWGNHEYDEKWQEYCKPHSNIKAEDLYLDVLPELSRYAKNHLGSSKEYVSIMKGIKPIFAILGVILFNPVLLLYAGGMHYYTQIYAPNVRKNVRAYEEEWAAYSKEHIVDSIKRIKEVAYQQVLEYIKPVVQKE